MNRHAGRNNKTGTRLAVLYLENPHKAGTTLAVQPDALPIMAGDALNKIMSSAKANAAQNLMDVLHAEVLPNGQVFSQYLFDEKRIISMDIEDVDMTPTPTQIIALETILENIKKADAGELTKKDAPLTSKTSELENENDDIIASRKIQQIELLMHDIRQYITDANDYSPAVTKRELTKLNIKAEWFFNDGQEVEPTKMTSGLDPEEVKKALDADSVKSTTKKTAKKTTKKVAKKK